MNTDIDIANLTTMGRLLKNVQHFFRQCLEIIVINQGEYKYRLVVTMSLTRDEAY